MVKNSVKPVSLALQGGGSHGAFTWGVLDRLLDDDRLRIEAISSVSSGAMNACALASGFIEGGADGAKQCLKAFWHEVSDKYSELFFSGPPNLWEKVAGLDYAMPIDSYLSLTQTFSPYQLNPFNINPLRDILKDHINFDALRKHSGIKLCVGATEIRTGKLRIFHNHEITVDALLASACLPSLHHAIEIDGEPYWDGGYSGNPPLSPLIFNSDNPDILIVLLQPLLRDEIPKTVEEIRKRSNELTFTNTFLREMRAIALSKEHIKGNWLRSGKLEKKMRRLNIHIIEDRSFDDMDADTRYSADADFIDRLYEQGVTNTGEWLSKNYRFITRRSSVDLVKTFV